MLEIVCGKPGAGKTSYVVAHVINEEFRFNNSRYHAARRYIKQMNSLGQNLTPPPNRHAVFANFDIYRKYPNMKNYEISGWDFGVPNDIHKTTKRLMPYGLYVFDEAQRYFDSKSDKPLPPWVTQAFELRRHISMDIYLIAQRYIRIHKDIRDIADVFTYIDEIQHTYVLPSGRKIKSDKLLPIGKLIKTVWKYHQFESEDLLSQYIAGEKSLGVKGKYEFNGDINKHYNTHAYATMVEDLSKDFSYYDRTTLSEKRPESWDNFKKVTKVKTEKQVNEKTEEKVAV